MSMARCRSVSLVALLLLLFVDTIAFGEYQNMYLMNCVPVEFVYLIRKRLVLLGLVDSFFFVGGGFVEWKFGNCSLVR